MKKQAVRHGFALKEEREIREIKATANLYEHEKSGARLIHLACEDTNKVFCITFKTIPEDNTGCPHILEHSVLNGSKNFPGKATFMELTKGSLHTFINAMTAPDATYYPIASTNDQDFLNLTRVYLDAVFFPMIYTQPNILHQEGWHHELTDKDGDLHIKGVVYNEMKGAFSSPDSLIGRYNLHAQFPDTSYGFESGGDPQYIPTLTNEKFIAFHSKYYHPSNSYIFLYGDMDVDKSLELIDKDYLSQFERSDALVEIALQKPFAKVARLQYDYPVEENKDISDQYYLSLNYTYGHISDRFGAEALNVLAEILMQTTASPLKRAIMASGLAKDCNISTSTNMLQPTFSIVCKKVNKENIPALEKLIHDELKHLATKGIDKKLIEGVLNSREFFMREAQMNRFPKGLYYSWNAYPYWIQGADPLDALGFEDLLQELRRGLTEPYFEQLLDEALLKNKHASVITYVPVPGMTTTQDAALKEKLAEVKAKMTAKDIEKLVQFNKELLDWQAEEVSTEDLERIPKLDIADIGHTAASYPLEVEKLKEYTLLKHPVNTNGIVYLKGYYDLSHAGEENLPWLALYTYLTGEVDSQNYSYADLSNEIDIHTGGISLGLNLKVDYQDPDLILPKFVVYGKALRSRVEKLTELAAEYALRPVFTDTARISMLIREAKAKMEAQLLRGGMTVAINRMYAPFSQYHHFTDLMSGLDYYHFLCGLDKRLDKDIVDIMDELEWVRKTFFCRKNLLISLTADEDSIRDTIKYLQPLIDSASAEDYPAVEEHYHLRDCNEAILAPVKIQFCVKGGNFFRKGYPYSGKLRVLNNILSSEFLHREIREKGGAYGAMANFTLMGNMFFGSYMDPNLQETLDVYDQVPEYLRGFDCSKREMEKYIIGDISNLDYPKTPEGIGVQSDDDFITGFTQEDRQQIRNEVLSTKVEDIRAFAGMIEEIMSKNHFCVFGNETRIRESAEIFTKLTPIFQ